MEWTKTFLDEKRKRQDPLADKAAASLFKLIMSQDTTKDKKKVSKFITEFVSHDFTHKWDHSKHDVEIPKDLFDYFEDMSPFEFTHDESAILERGSKFFVDHGPKAILTLYGRSLIKQYAHTQAIQVLRMTRLLEDHVHRRIIETMQFVVDVMNPTWHHHHDKEDKRKFNTNHVGKQSIQKLRLVHAMVRYKINNNLSPKSQGEWKEEEWGKPINQEDMIFATHTFSIEVIKGLQQLGTKLTKEEINDYYQSWNLIGRALGVDQDLIPDNYEDGVKLQDLIYERHFTLPNETGPRLAKDLVNWLVKFPLFKEQTALTFIKACNDLKGEHLIETNLGLKLGHAHDDLAEHANELNIPGIQGKKVTTEEEIEEDPTEQLIVYFIEHLLKTERGGKKTNFRIGDGFLSEWNINEDREEPMSKIMMTLTAAWLSIKALFLKMTGYFKKGKSDNHGDH